MVAAPATQQIAKAEAIGDRMNSSEQQWVVLAAWEEVRTISRRSISDYDMSATTNELAQDGTAQTLQSNSGSAGKATRELPNQTRNYTVTQLILKVVPANSTSTQPEAGFARGGWFVFQL
jgi:hypothetical protein